MSRPNVPTPCNNICFPPTGGLPFTSVAGVLSANNTCAIPSSCGNIQFFDVTFNETVNGNANMAYDPTIFTYLTLCSALPVPTGNQLYWDKQGCCGGLALNTPGLINGTAFGLKQGTTPESDCGQGGTVTFFSGAYFEMGLGLNGYDINNPWQIYFYATTVGFVFYNIPASGLLGTHTYVYGGDNPNPDVCTDWNTTVTITIS